MLLKRERWIKEVKLKTLGISKGKVQELPGEVIEISSSKVQSFWRQEANKAMMKVQTVKRLQYVTIMVYLVKQSLQPRQGGGLERVSTHRGS